MFRDRKLHVVQEPARAPLRLAIIQPVKDTLRTWFSLPASGTDLKAALGFGVEVARHLQLREETQRASELDLLIAGCEAADASNGDLPQAVTPPVSPEVTKAPVGSVDLSSSPDSGQDNVSVLPVTKSVAELSSIFSEAHAFVAEAEKLVGKAGACVQKAESTTMTHIDGQNQQLVTQAKVNTRLQGTVRELTAANQKLSTQLARKEEELRTTRESRDRISGELNEAQAKIREHSNQLSSAAVNGFMRGVGFAAVVTLVIWCIAHFVLGAH